MSELIYRTYETAGEDGYGANTKYHKRPDAALEELRSEVWAEKDSWAKKQGRTTLAAFVPKGFSLDERKFQDILQEYLAAYRGLWSAKRNHSSAESKAISKVFGKRLSELPLIPNLEGLVPSDEILVKIQAGAKKASYSDPMAIVKGLINNSDRMDEFTVLVRNGTYIPNLRAIEILLQSCVDEAKHLVRWRDNYSTYDMATVHARNDFDRALAKEKVAELKELLAF